MRLQELLNKFTNTDFLITVNGWCDEMPFYEYEDEKKQDYWKKYKDRKVIGMSILTTNFQPELRIKIAPEAALDKYENSQNDRGKTV
jgi:hypothetical protein